MILQHVWMFFLRIGVYFFKLFNEEPALGVKILFPFCYSALRQGCPTSELLGVEHPMGCTMVSHASPVQGYMPCG